MDIIVMVLIIAGLLFFFATTVGILRFPDFYTRMHAAGKGDTLSSLLMLLALTLYNFQEFSLANLLLATKILLIAVFIFMASPTATHAITDAGYESGVKPWTKNPEDESQDDLAA
jgi:multicomponent Na+:H+ antiporter subunit G